MIRASWFWVFSVLNWQSNQGFWLTLLFVFKLILNKSDYINNIWVLYMKGKIIIFTATEYATLRKKIQQYTQLLYVGM